MKPQEQRTPPESGGTVASAIPAGGFFARDDVARILPFALYMLFIAIADGLAALGWGDSELRWLYPVKTAIVVAALLAYRRRYSELAWRTMTFGVASLSVLTGIVVLVLWVNLDAGWMQMGAAAGYDPTDGNGRIDWLLVAIRIAGAALVVPVMEELFWRSFLMRWIARHDFLNVYPARVGLRAVAFTVVLFGIEHHLWFAGMVAGLAYALLYMKTGNLWSPILAHAVTNGLLGAWVLMTGQWIYW